MKKLISLFFVAILFGAFQKVIAQDNTPVRPDAPYLSNKNIPAFSLLLADGKNFTQNDIPSSKYTIIIYFSPDFVSTRLQKWLKT